MKEISNQSHICTRCQKEIAAGESFIGDGDGTGQRFAHVRCYRDGDKAASAIAQLLYTYARPNTDYHVQPRGHPYHVSYWEHADAVVRALGNGIRITPETEVAVVAALQELARWPDLPGIPFFVYHHKDGQISKSQIAASEVEGIFRAMMTHMENLRPFAKQAIDAVAQLPQAQQKIKELQDRIRLLEDQLCDHPSE